MRTGLTTVVLLGAVLACVAPAAAQTPRLDAIWARSTNGAKITLDGYANEPAWALAESVVVRYGVDNGIPGSGYQEEGGKLSKDSTFAVIRFLTDGDSLYMFASLRDTSVGGDVDFNKIDGLQIGIKDHSVSARPAPIREYFYTWWFPVDTLHAHDPGRGPCFRGWWAQDTCSESRTAEQIQNWDAVTIVNGVSNQDSVGGIATPDEGWNVEMKFALVPMGYDVTRPGGDIIEWNLGIKDSDWNWPINLQKFSANRTWWQSPWSLDAWYDEVHIYSDPDVTISSGPAPPIPPEVRVANAGGWPAPAIDGYLNDPVWSLAPHFDIRWADDALRATYPGVGPWRSGQWQPSVNDTVAVVRNPADATVYWFFKDDTLYFGFDVRDKYVQYIPLYTRYDGIAVNLNDRGARYRDRNLEARWLTYLVGPDGNGLALDYLPYLRDTLLGARVALQLKGSTTVDTVGFEPDSGYTIEMAIDLTKLGYPHGLGDRALFLGINLMDGDSFGPSGVKRSYGTHQWWFWHQQRECCPVWAYLDPYYYLTTDVPGPQGGGPYALLGNYPNPFRSLTTIAYALAAPSDVTLEVFDLQGRRVVRRVLGLQGAGQQHATFSNPGLRTGVYMYRVRAADPLSGKPRAALSGKMLILK